MRKILIFIFLSVISQLAYAEGELPASVVEGMNRLKKKRIALLERSRSGRDVSGY